MLTELLIMILKAAGMFIEATIVGVAILIIGALLGAAIIWNALQNPKVRPIILDATRPGVVNYKEVLRSTRQAIRRSIKRDSDEMKEVIDS